MFRDSEKQYLLSLDIQPMVDTYLYLAKVYLRLDQPLLSITKLQEGLVKFPYEPCLIQAIARIYEVCFTKFKENLFHQNIFFHRVLMI
jgi:tetratricopeptide repeat protein 8